MRLQPLRPLLNTRGFTLIEALLAISLMAVISLTAVSVFSLGLQIWKRTKQMNTVERKAVLSLERMESDLRSAVRFAPVKDTFSIENRNRAVYKGDSLQIMIPSTVIAQGPKDTGGYARKTYRWESSKKQLCRSIEKASDIYRRNTPPCEVLAKNVTKFKMRYRLPSGLADSYSWYDEWDGEGGLPMAVEIEMEITPEAGLMKKTFKRTVVIPASGE